MRDNKLNRICLLVECQNIVDDRAKTGYCQNHYTMAPGKPCVIDGCTKTLAPTNKNGFCIEHRYIGKNHRYTYNIDILLYEELRERQNGSCPLCNECLPKLGEQVPKGSTPVIDHDHSCCSGRKTCGKCVRGILHFGCNLELGQLEMLRQKDWSAFDEYLDEWGKKESHSSGGM